jgi:hypothetical protein
MKYQYIHCISYYHGNDRKENLLFAFNRLNKCIMSTSEPPYSKKLLIVYICCDTINDEIKEEYKDYESLHSERVDTILLYRFNSGGTIQTMYNMYNYLIDNNISSDYIGIFEDDAIFKDVYILDVVSKYLKDGMIMTGPFFKRENSTQEMGIKKLYIDGFGVNKNRQVPICKKKHIYLEEKSEELIDDELYKWVDGCGYFTTLVNLTTIKNKMGKFTLAPENERYTHIEHGINYGEVGFCIRLFINNFNIIGLSANIYYEQLIQKSIGDKNI